MNSGIITPGSLNLHVNPLTLEPGDMIRAVNVTNDVFGAKKKRPGYVTHLDSLGGEVTSLFNFTMNNGSFWNYAVAGGSVFYSTQGTGDWTIAGNGTLTSGAYVVPGIFEDKMIIGDGTAVTRHTSDGTSFTNTTSAPISQQFVPYQGRMYALGTASQITYSNVGDPTDWVTDSASRLINGAGRNKSLFKAADRLVITKTSAEIYRYDGFNLVDAATDLGPTSPQSVADVEDYRIWLNRLGFFGFGGDRPEILSNPIEKIVYNDAGDGIAGTIFDNAPAVVHKYEYMASVGTVTDDLTSRQITNAVPVYDYQADEWWVNSFAVRPTAMLSYKDENGVQQMIFGDSTGQCYTYGGTATSDNGSPISVEMEGVISMKTFLDKKWDFFRALFNPGCQATVQIAITDTFTRADKDWIDLGDVSSGVAEFRFPEGTRGKFLFWRVSESSENSRLQFYGMEVSAEPIVK